MSPFSIINPLLVMCRTLPFNLATVMYNEHNHYLDRDYKKHIKFTAAHDAVLNPSKNKTVIVSKGKKVWDIVS